MIHLYCGDGKGKTTAACGLCIRAVGSGMGVLFVQFFKSGKSFEVSILSSLDGVTVCHPELHYGRVKGMNPEQRKEICASYNEFLRKIISRAQEFDMMILDEIVSAYMHEVIDRKALTEFLESEGKKREIVLTGRNPAPELIQIADYVTEMCKLKHPYDSGIAARKGIEY